MLKLLLLFFSRSVCSALCNPMNGSMPGFFVFQNSCSLLKLKSIESVMPSNHLILLPPSPLALNLYQHQGLSSELALCIRWPKYWSFSFSIGPSNEYSGLISFRMDWLDLLAVQGTLKSLVQHHSSKESILQCSAFFVVQLSHPYTTTGKTTSSIQFSRSVVSNSFRPHESQHARPPCPHPLSQ